MIPDAAVTAFISDHLLPAFPCSSNSKGSLLIEVLMLMTLSFASVQTGLSDRMSTVGSVWTLGGLTLVLFDLALWFCGKLVCFEFKTFLSCYTALLQDSWTKQMSIVDGLHKKAKNLTLLRL